MNNKTSKTFFGYVLFILIFSLMGCSKNNIDIDIDNIEFKFNSNNEYLGFKELKFISIKDARKCKIVILENGYLTDGQDLWKEFYNNSKKNIDTQIRIYNVVEDKDYYEYIDIFYQNSLYYIFSSNDMDNNYNTTNYKYLYDLNDTSLNNLESFFIVCSNSSDITYKQIMNNMLSSKYINKDYKIVIWGIR